MNGTETTKIFADRVSELINEECKKQNITLEELGERIGVKRSSLSKYQNDNSEPGINSAVKIAQYFGVTLDYLCGMEDYPTHENESIGSQTGLSDRAIKKIALLKAISDGSYTPTKSKTSTYSILTYPREYASIELEGLNVFIEDAELLLSFGKFIMCYKNPEVAFPAEIIDEETELQHERSFDINTSINHTMLVRTLWKTFYAKLTPKKLRNIPEQKEST